MQVSMRFRVFFLFFLFAILVTACQMQQKGRKPSPDWSRGMPLGAFVQGDVDLVVAADGSLVHFVWLTKDEADRSQVQYMVVDETAVIQLNQPIDISDTQVRYPRLILGDDDTVHLLWSSREENARNWDLWYGQLDEVGNFRGETVRLAPATDDIERYDIVADGAGGLFVVWEKGVDDTLVGAQIGLDGTILQPEQYLADGVSPSIKMDEMGSLHMAWLSGVDVSYAQWLDGDLATAVSTIITTFSDSSGGRLSGPELGVADEWGYILWSNYFSTGLQAGTAVSEYVAFSLDDPQLTNPKPIRVAPDERHLYESYQGAYNLTQLAPPADTQSSSYFVREPKATTGQGDELAVALTMSQSFRLNDFIQVAIALFKDGDYIGYQMAGKTEAFSQKPTLATDDMGDLYIAWRDGGRGSLALYALTSEGGQATLNRMDSNDVASVALNGGVEMIAGILFFPLACVWLMPGFLLIGIYHFWKGESDLKEPVTIVILVVSIIVSQGMKFIFLPTITTYVPFSAWFDIPVGWGRALIMIVPVTTAVIGLIFAWFMHKRTESGLAFFFWFTAADGILTLAIYGVNFLGVF